MVTANIPHFFLHSFNAPRRPEHLQGTRPAAGHREEESPGKGAQVGPDFVWLLTSPGVEGNSNACVSWHPDPPMHACPGKTAEGDLGECVICALTRSSTILIITDDALMSLTVPGVCKAVRGSKALSRSLLHLRSRGQEGLLPFYR